MVIRAAAPNADLANGRGAQMFFLGANYDHDFDNGWSISNKFLYNAGDVDTNALFSGSNPAPLNDELYTIPTDLGGFAAAGGFGDRDVRRRWRGRARPERDPSRLVVHPQGARQHQQRLPPEQGIVRREHADDRPLSRLLRDGRRMGARQPDVHDERAERAAHHRELSSTRWRRPFLLTDEQGFLDNGGFNITQRGHAFNRAIYLSDSWRIDKWLLDASVRFENQDATNRVCNLSNVDLDAQCADAVQQRRPRVQRHVRGHGLRRGLHLVDGRRQLQLHGRHVRVRAREPRRSLPRLRQRHPRQHHRQHAAHAGHPQLRGRVQVPERPVLCRHQRVLPRLHRPAVPAHERRRHSRRRPAALRLRIDRASTSSAR